MKNKKLIVILAILVIGILLFGGYRTFLSPQAVEGSKEVTIQIIVENEDINKEHKYKTDLEYVLNLLEENKDELGAILTESDFGVYVSGMAEYEADPTSEYFHIIVNGTDAVVGIAEIPLNDGDVYIFEVRSF